MLFSELAKRVAEKYPEVKTAYPMDCELSNVELYDPSGAVPPVDSLSIYTARQIGQDMTLPLCFVCAGTPDQAAHDKIAYSDSNYIIIPQVSVVDVVYYIMSLFGDSFKQQKLYSNLIYMLLNGADLTSVFCEFSKGTGSQLLAIDISGKVLAYSKPFRVNHPHWIHSIEVGYLDNYLIEYILSYRVKHKMDMSPNTFVLFCNRLQMYIKVIRVIADNEIIGYVFMGNYTGEFPWFSDKLMHLLAKNLHSTLLGSRSYSTYRFNMHQSVLSDIIDGASEEETIQRINAAKLTFPPNMRAVVLKPSYFRGNEYLYDVLMPRVAEILPASPRVYKKNAIVTFVGVNNAGALPEETRTAIETLAADGQVLVGVSNLFHKPSKLYVYYQQALQAMSFSRRLSNTGGVFFFSDYAFYIMLDRMEDKPLLEQCRHPVLASLEAYDAGAAVLPRPRPFSSAGIQKRAPPGREVLLFFMRMRLCSVIVALERLELGVELFVLAQVGLDAREAVAQHLVGVHVRVHVELLVLHGAEQTRADKAGVVALVLDAAFKIGLVVLIVAGRVEGIIRLLELLGAALLAVPDRGVDVFRAERGHTNVRRVVDGIVLYALGKAHRRVLGCGVGRLDAHAGLQTADGDGEQEVGVGALLFHDGQHFRDVVGHAEEVDAGDPVPVLGRDVAQRAGAGNTGVAVEHIDALKLRHDALDAHANLLVLGHVHGDRDDFGRTQRFAFLLDLLQPVAFDVDQRKVHAAACGLQCEGFADAVGGAGDAGHFSSKFFHCSYLRLFRMIF